MTSSTTNHWKLGLFVVCGLALTLSCLTWLGLERLERKYVVSNYYFDETVDGLSLGSPVKFRGVTVGNVLEINVAPDQRHVQVVSAIFVDRLEQLGLPSLDELESPEADSYVHPAFRVQLNRSLLTGVTFIQGDFFDPDKHPVPEYPFEVPYNTIHSVPSTFKSIESGMTDVVDLLPGLAEQATLLMAHLDASLVDLDLADLSLQTQDLMRVLTEKLDGLENLEVIRRASATLEEAELAAREIRSLASDFRQQDGPLMRLAKHLEAVGRTLEEEIGDTRLADTTAAVRAVSVSAAGAADQFTLVSSELRAEIAAMRTTLNSIRAVFEMLERDPSSLIYGKTSSSVFNRSKQ